MRARSLATACAVALVVAAAAAADWQTSAQVVQDPIQVGSLAPATLSTLTPACTKNLDYTITLAWSPSTTPRSISYTVYRRTSSPPPVGAWTLVPTTPVAGGAVTSPALTDFAVPPNTPPRIDDYMVQASFANWTSDSNVLSVAVPKKTC